MSILFHRVLNFVTLILTLPRMPFINELCHENFHNTNTKKAFQCTHGTSRDMSLWGRLSSAVKATVWDGTRRSFSILSFWEVYSFPLTKPLPSASFLGAHDKAALLCFSTFPRICSKSTSCYWVEAQLSSQPSAFPQLAQRKHVLALPQGERKTVWQNRAQLIWTTQDNTKFTSIL